MSGARIFLALTSIGLPGCAAMIQQDWHDAPTHAALTPYHVEVPESDLRRVCQGHPAMRTYGCAFRHFADGLCIIYTGPKPAPWLIDHERKHCAGWDHGDTPGSAR